MYNSEFISASKLAKYQPEMFQKLEEKKRLVVVRNNDPLCVVVSINDPVVKLFDIVADRDEVFRLEDHFETTLSEHWRQSFMARHGDLTEATDNHNIDRLLGLDGSELMRELPVKDHYTLWLKDGQPELFSMEVYTLHMDSLNALHHFCALHKLTYHIEGRSWYLPGRTTLIVISRNKNATGNKE